MRFTDSLQAASARHDSLLCVGLDPEPSKFPGAWKGDARRVFDFCARIVDATKDTVCAFKPQIAYFAAHGAEGALQELIAHIRTVAPDVPVILDAKRGDIGSTSRAYAAAYLEPRGDDPPLADAMTVNVYLGRDSMDPYLAACRRHGAGLFCVLNTSNEGGADVQGLALSDGRQLWQHLARMIHELGQDIVGERGLSSVGAVVGATHPRAVGEARRLIPQAVLLLPGVGAQGGSPADLARAFTSGPASALVSASRSVLYAFRSTDEDWRTAAALEAARLRREVWAVAGW